MTPVERELYGRVLAACLVDSHDVMRATEHAQRAVANVRSYAERASESPYSCDQTFLEYLKGPIDAG